MISKDRDVGFVASKNPEQVKLRETYDRLPLLFGSLAKVDKDGFILIPQWPTLPRGEANPDQFTVLQKHPWSDEAALKTGWKSKTTVAALTIKRITKDDGHIQTAIRFCDHVLENIRGKEKDQVSVVANKANFFLNQFSEKRIKDIGATQLAVWQEETIQSLLDVGLDPKTVNLEVKMLMALWLIKASGGKDLTDRINELIANHALVASKDRAEERQLTLDSQMTDKYVQMKVALTFAETLSRKPMEIVSDELINRFLYNRFLVNPDARIGKSSDINYTKGKARSLAWLLTQTWVRPYRPLAGEVKDHLEVLIEKLNPEKKGEVFSLDLPQILHQDAEKMRAVLS